jgi:hypothetical protein
VLLSVDLLSKQLIEINWVVLARGSFCAQLHDIELILQTFVETHDHVKAITFQYLEQKQVGSTGLITDGNSAA